MKGMVLFILDILLFVCGGVLERFYPALGLVVMLLGVLLLLFLWRADRRGWL